MKGLIFVLEDDVGIRRLLRYPLESAGFEFRVYSALRSLVEDAPADAAAARALPRGE